MARALVIGVRKAISALALAIVMIPSLAAAQDRVTLDEVLPALSGTDIGAIELGAAPPPGNSRIVRRSEVLNALRRAGRPSDGLAIPRSTRIHRGARQLNETQLERLIGPAVHAALAPCTIGELVLPEQTTLPSGGLDVSAEARRPSRSGRATAVAIIRSGARETRVPVRAAVTCPPPSIEPGSRVNVVVWVGNVRATAQGEARQPGRIGDSIRVRIASGNRRTVEARVVNAQTVELLR